MNPTPTDPREGEPFKGQPEKQATYWKERYEIIKEEHSKLAAEIAELKRGGRCECRFAEPPIEYHQGFKVEPGAGQMIWTNRCALHAVQVEKETATLRAELEAVNTRYSELAAKRAKTDQLYQLALNNQEDLGKRLEAARKERDKAVKFANDVEWSNERFKVQVDEQLKRISEMPLGKTIHESLADAVARTLAAKDTAEKRVDDVVRERELWIHELRFAANRGCLYERLETLLAPSAALTPAPTQEPPAGGVTISNDSAGISTRPLRRAGDTSDGSRAGAVTISTEKKGGDEPCRTIHSAATSAPATDGVAEGHHAPNVRSNSPADVQPEGRRECAHELKIWPPYFDAVNSGLKTFEIRKLDRDYRVGDRLHLREWMPEKEAYTGRRCCVVVTYITTWEQREGYGVLGIRREPPPMLPTEGSGA